MLHTRCFSPFLLFLLSSFLLPALASAQCDPEGNPFGGGDGSVGAPFQICSADQMNRVAAASMSNHYSLESDISMTSISSYNVPGTTFGTAFTGSFDGNGYTIYDFGVTGSQDGLGLFGFTNGATFQNVSLENASVSGTDTGNQYHVAALVGYGADITISDIQVSGSVTTTNADNVALVVGYVYGNSSSISNCYAYGELSGRDSIGGIVGSLHDGTITRSTAEVTINARQNLASIAGQARYSSQEPQVSECIGFGSITVSSGRAAGLVGYCESCQVSDSYSGTSILGSANLVGGAIGQSDDDIDDEGADSELNRIFSYGSAAGNSNVGGAVGGSADTNSANIYWDSEASGNGSSALGTGLTTSNAQQESSFTGFDFTNTWEIDEGNSYPTLRNNPVLPSPTASPTASPSASATPSMSPSMTPSASVSVSPSASASVSASPSTSASPSVSVSTSPSASSTISPEVTPSPSPSPSPSKPSSDKYKDDLSSIGKELLDSQEGREQAKQLFQEILDFGSDTILAKPGNKKAKVLKRKIKKDLKQSKRLVGDENNELTKKVATRIRKLLKKLLKRLDQFEKNSA